jgi:hypothetical protein
VCQRSAKCYAPLHSGSAGEAVLTAVICFGLCASEEWGFAYMLRSGSKLVSACNLTLPLVAACSCACVLRAFPAGIARLRDRIRRLRATCISKEDQQIMQPMIIRPKHISVRNPQASGPRSRSALCSRRRRYDARIPPIFADDLRSSVLCIQCRQARGGIPLVAISVRACMPGQRIFTSRTRGTGIVFFISTSPRGLWETPRPTGAIGDKLGSGMPAANADGPNLQRTNPSVRSKTD